MFQLLDTYRLESSSVDRGEVPGEGGETPGEGVEGSPGDLEAHARGTSDPRCTAAKTVPVHHPAENDKIKSQFNSLKFQSIKC